ncbi:MAG: replication endonuclease [Cellvibrionaceae bacterium]
MGIANQASIDAIQVDVAFEVGDTPACRAWRERIFNRHRSLVGYWRKQHQKRVISEGFVKANRWLGQQEAALKIGRSGLFCDCEDHEIVDYAEAKSKKVEQQIHEAAQLIGTASQFDKDRISDFIRAEVEAAGLDYPLPEFGYTKDEMIGAFARVCDPALWRRQLRETAVKQYEHYVLQLGLVGLSGDIYCSEYTLRRWQDQKRRNRYLLESLEAENSQGQVFTLAELSDLSVSNPINRRNELMTRISGFEEYAKNHPCESQSSEQGKFVCLFLTLTAPSKYHAKCARKAKSGRRYSISNPKYQGYNPRQTNDYLCGIWACIRSEWARRGISPYGFRMVEPHHDGTPHWHMVLFLPETRAIECSYVFNHYALREDRDEYGADEYRSKIVFIDPEKGSAAGYCAKYVAKNIDGYSLDTDLYGRDAVMSAMRIEAWASAWGIRQFQQIGGPSVTVWREARRIKEEQLIDITPEAKAIIEAADSGDWESYVDLMGGAVCPLEERPIRPKMLPRSESNKYNEFTETLVGLLAFGRVISTRQESWVIRPVAKSSANDAANWPSSKAGFYAKQPQAA